jgi:Protein of unknown function (DUF2580).
MGDYNYYTKQSIEVATDAIREESKKWYRLSDRMERIYQTTRSLSLELAAFMVVDPVTGPIAAADLKRTYDGMHNKLTTLFQQATKELELFGDALKRAADAYERSDANSAVNLNEIWKGK